MPYFPLLAFWPDWIYIATGLGATGLLRRREMPDPAAVPIITKRHIRDPAPFIRRPEPDFRSGSTGIPSGTAGSGGMRPLHLPRQRDGIRLGTYQPVPAARGRLVPLVFRSGRRGEPGPGIQPLDAA